MKKIIIRLILLLPILTILITVEKNNREKLKKNIDEKQKIYRENTSLIISGNVFKIESITSFSYALFIKADSVNIPKTAVEKSGRISGVYDENTKIGIILSISKQYDATFFRKKLRQNFNLKAIINQEISTFYFTNNELNLNEEISNIDVNSEEGKYLFEQIKIMQNPIKF